MRLTWEPITLDLKTPFRIAHGTYHHRHNVLVRLESGGCTGIGEAPAVVYYGETQEVILDYLKTVPELGDDPFDFEAVLKRLPPGSKAGRAAIDVALHDLWGKLIGQPLYRLFGLNPGALPDTSFTIAMDEPEEMGRKACACGYPILKIKLGGGQDEAMVAAIRKATDAKLRVDANAGWSREEAERLIPRLAEHGLELVEQPLAADDLEGLRWLRRRMKEAGVAVPIVADESVHGSKDVAQLAGAVDGIVVKVMKTEGLREALRTIHTARAFEMQVMLSCMVETSVGVTAAAHLAPLCDYVDLDGPLLIANDPFRGLRFDGARLALPEGPGLGVEPVVR